VVLPHEIRVVSLSHPESTSVRIIMQAKKREREVAEGGK
jgi:hypothetical protein